MDEERGGSNNSKGGHRGVDYESVDEEYFAERQLRQGAAGWVLLAGLGVAYVISGDFAGWNFGLKEGGWGGLLVATILMATMYSCMVFALAELSSIIPAAGGGYGFARRAFGPWGGFLTGTAILIEYAIAPAAIATFIGAYCHSLFGAALPWLFPGGETWLVALIAFVFVIGRHLWGVGEALKLMFVITAVAVVALLVFVGAMIPHFEVANLFDIAPTEALGASSFLPFGLIGIWAALPYAMWFFLAIEGVPLAAEETRDPARDMPRGLIAGMSVLLVFAALILVLGPGGAGASTLMAADDPLFAALESPTAYGEGFWLSSLISAVGLAGLIASFFSLIFAYSRQIFALSRAGYLPRWLSRTNRRNSPALALIVPGAVGFVLSILFKGDLLIPVAVFGATISYVMMMASHIALRRREPDLERPYRTPGGAVTSGVALVLACAALIASLLVEPWAIVGAAVVYAVLIAYFALYSRHRLVAQAPEEEFDAIARAEAELER